MSALEETIQPKQAVRPKTAPVLNRILDFFSSVRFGVVQLCLLVILALIGMLIIQQNVQGFDSYYASLTPAEKSVFGFLGFFNIYYSWYFNLLLLTLSLNIVLASIDKFPSAWSYISKPKLFATREWLLGQGQNAIVPVEGNDEEEIVKAVRGAFEEHKFKTRLTEKTFTSYAVDENGKKNFTEKIIKRNVFVFGESGRINRLGAYIVHVALLTLFLGHFIALQTGFDADVRMTPGTTTDKIQMIQYDLDKKSKFDVQVPFTMICTDIQQTLLNPQGGIGVDNTMDWRTQVKFVDPAYGETIADISMNRPFSYRGYRFFQAQTIPQGNARTMTIEASPSSGGEPVKVNLSRNGSTELPDGTKIEYEGFYSDFTFAEGKADSRSPDYNNPAVALKVTPPNDQPVKVFAFGKKLPDNIPVSAPKAGFRWRLSDFERSPLAHVLSIKYDPYNGAFIAWYFGGFGLIGALIYVFFFSHKRVWALIGKSDDGCYEIVLGAHANRNQHGLEDKFNRILDSLKVKSAGTVKI